MQTNIISISEDDSLLFSKYYTKTIKDIFLYPSHKGEVNNDILCIKFEDSESYLEIYDGGQLCCENRYLTTDDVITDIIGQKFLGVAVKKYEVIPTNDAFLAIEVVFFDIQTDKDCITFCAHNEHNGWYSGFDIKARENIKNNGDWKIYV